MPRRAPAETRNRRTEEAIEAMIGQTIEEITRQPNGDGSLTIHFDTGLIVCIYADLTNDMVVDIEERPQGEPIAGEPRTPPAPKEDEDWEAETEEDDEWPENSREYKDWSEEE